MKKSKIALYYLGLIVSVIYILNPGADLWEILPDNLPFVGNLDEGAAAALLLYCLNKIRSSREQNSESNEIE